MSPFGMASSWMIATSRVAEDDPSPAPSTALSAVGPRSGERGALAQPDRTSATRTLLATIDMAGILPCRSVALPMFSLILALCGATHGMGNAPHRRDIERLLRDGQLPF